jgi:hypothetical protein
MNDEWVNDVIGKKWKEYATGPDCFDCWGIVCHGFKHKQGIQLDRHLEIPTLNPIAFHKVVSKEIKTGNWQQLQQPEDGCLILMSAGRLWHHVGMWLDINGGRLLHSQDGIGVSLNSKHSLNSFNAVEFWKYVPTTHPASSI